MTDHVKQEAKRRVNAAADMLASAIRLGADGDDARRAMNSAVQTGAEQLAQDTIEAWESPT